MRKNKIIKILDQMLFFFLFPVYFFYKLFPRKNDLNHIPKNVLIIKLCCFGDTILSLFAMKSIKESFPNSNLTIVSSKRNADIFLNVPFIDKVIILPVTGLKGSRELNHLFNIIKNLVKIKNMNFETIIDFDVHYRFTTIISLISCPKFSSGFNSKSFRASFYGHSVARYKNEPEWKSFYRLITPLNINIKTPKNYLVFRSSLKDKKYAEEIIAQTHPSKIKIGIVPGASNNWKEKIWPTNYYMELIKKLNKSRDYFFYIFGIDEEIYISSKITKNLNHIDIIDLTGKTNFIKLVEIFKRMDLIISNDTGPMHLSTVLGINTLGIFGPTNDKKWSLPFSNFQVITNENCLCRPCYYMSKMPKCLNRECLTGIDHNRVADVVFSILKDKK